VAAVDVGFALDVTLDASHRITGVHAGHPYEAYAAGCEIVRTTAMEWVYEPYDVVVTTNSGYPLDQNRHQAVKGICAAAGIVRDGSAVLVDAECSDGLSAHGRYRALLGQWRDRGSFLRAVTSGELHAHDQWQVQKQALVLERAWVLVHAAGLTDKEVRNAWFEPAPYSPTSSRSATERSGAGCRIAVLPAGPQSIAYFR
jgi:nickel-dependent lactate racemase